MGDRLPAFLRDHECCGLVWSRGVLFFWHCSGFFYAGDEETLGRDLRGAGGAIGDRAVFRAALLLRRAGVAASIGGVGVPGQGAAAADVRAVAGDTGAEPCRGALASAEAEGAIPDQAREGSTSDCGAEKRGSNLISQVARSFANHEFDNVGGPCGVCLEGEHASKWAAIHNGEIPRLTNRIDRQLCRVVVESAP